MRAAHSPPNVLPCPPEGITTTVRVAETGLDDVREARRRNRVEPSFHEKDRDVTGRLGQRPPGDRSNIPRLYMGYGQPRRSVPYSPGSARTARSAELIVVLLSADSEVPFSPVAWSPGTVSCAASVLDDPGVTRSDRLRRRREDGDEVAGVLRSEAPRHHLLTAHDEQRAVRVAHRRCVRVRVHLGDRGVLGRDRIRRALGAPGLGCARSGETRWRRLSLARQAKPDRAAPR